MPLPHSLMKKLGLNLLELLVEHSPAAGGFAEAAGTELCKGNVEEIADIELDRFPCFFVPLILTYLTL